MQLMVGARLQGSLKGSMKGGAVPRLRRLLADVRQQKPAGPLAGAGGAGQLRRRRGCHRRRRDCQPAPGEAVVRL